MLYATRDIIGIHDHIDDNDHVDNDGDGDDGDDSMQHHSNSKATTTPTSINDNDSDSNSHISGMFLAIGRLNHSCIPNAQQTFIPLLRKNS